MDRLTFLLLLLWVGVAVNTEVELQKRIIGGQTCRRDYHVKLRIVTSDGSCALCGGSLISERWILTAAHCFEPGWSIFAFVNVGGSPFKVHITEKPVIYKDKDNNNNDRQHDLMLLKLPGRSNNQPVALPERSDCGDKPKINDLVEIRGHAATCGGPNGERKSDVVPQLQCANINVVDCEGIRRALETNSANFDQDRMYQHFFCGQSSGVDVCEGDSGGGVVFKDKIYGVIAFTGDPKYVLKEAAGFMDLCNDKYNTWINETIAGQKKL